MRVLFTSTRGTGHVGQLLPFARACEDAGAEVLITAPAAAEPSVKAARLRFRPLAEAPPAERDAVFAALAADGPGTLVSRVTPEVFVRIDARAALPSLVETVEQWRPDVVVSEIGEFAGGVAAEQAGVPACAVGVTLGIQDAWVGEPLWEALDELRAEAGLPPDPDGERFRRRPYLTLSPSALDDARLMTGEVHRFRELAPPERRAEPAPWAAGERPLVYLTFGTVAPTSGYFPGLYRGALEALAGRDVRVLVTVGRDCDPRDLAPLPANAHAERWVPHDVLLASCAAVVCHGGSGTVRHALAAGVPLVVVPLFADQPFNAVAVERSGAGVGLHVAPGAGDPDEALARVRGVGAALDEVLGQPAYLEAAHRIAREVGALRPVSAAPRVLRRLAAERPAQRLVTVSS